MVSADSSFFFNFYFLWNGQFSLFCQEYCQHPICFYLISILWEELSFMVHLLFCLIPKIHASRRLMGRLFCQDHYVCLCSILLKTFVHQSNSIHQNLTFYLRNTYLRTSFRQAICRLPIRASYYSSIRLNKSFHRSAYKLLCLRFCPGTSLHRRPIHLSSDSSPSRA